MTVDGEVVEGGGNVSVRNYIVRDTRQQMERRSPGRLTEAKLQRGETAGSEALCPLNNHPSLIRASNDVPQN